MCGIFGSVGVTLDDRAIDQTFAAIHHRGPDGHGEFVDEQAKITLLHTRLAVIDLETGAQPLKSADGSLILIANGEIYGFEEIRHSLEAKGYAFATKSDSEVILYLYQEFGLECFQHLRGEFAFLLYDKKNRRLIAARDRFGIKPLYFARLADGFVFASEMKAIFASELVKPKLDPIGFDPLIEQTPDAVRFPFEKIEHVPPAHFVSIDIETLDDSRTCYWSSEIPDETARRFIPDPQDEDRASRTVLEELEDAVRVRLRSDVPVGLYLSGGVDLSVIGALMARNLKGQLHSFSIAFEGSERNEQEFARRASEFVNTIHHELVVTKKMLWDHLERSVWFSELPFATLAPVGKFLLSEEARKHVTVVLTGEGADEVFLGYRNYFKTAIEETRLANSNRTQTSISERRLKLGRFSPRFVERISLLLFHKRHRRTIDDARKHVPTARPDLKPVINSVQEARLAAMPLDILCFLGDREEMAHSLEARLPFLDHKLYEAAKFIPVDLKMKDGVEKAVLRRAAKTVLPDDLAERRKVGFMLTSDTVDLFGRDRRLASNLKPYLSRKAFKRAEIFSYRSYLMISLLARIPSFGRRSLKRVRRDVNKIMMYMMQTHILSEAYVENPPWKDAPSLGR